ATIEQIIQLKQAEVSLPYAAKYKKVDPSATIAQIIQLKQAGVSFSDAAEYKKADPSITIEEIIKRDTLVASFLAALDRDDQQKIENLFNSENINHQYYIGGGAFIPLLSAIKKNKLKTTMALINKGANVNAKIDGFTPLYLAAFQNNREIAKLLIEKGANIEETNAIAKKENNKKVLDFFKRLPQKSDIVITPEMEQFTNLYILNAMNKRLGNEYNQTKDKDTLAKWSDLIKKQKEAISSFGVPFQTPKDVENSHVEYMKKSIVPIKGVETVIYQRTRDKDGHAFDDQKRPVMIYIHGDGAENKMTTDRFDPILDYYLAQGYLIVSPNFSAASEIEDIYKVAMAFKEDSNLQKEYHINPKNIFTTSISAGSNRLLRLLTQIGKEKRTNPFSASHISTTVGAENFEKAEVAFFPKEMDYLIIHGENDNPQPVHRLYELMKESGLRVDAQFLTYGGHHLIAGKGTDSDPTLTNETPKSDARYRDLLSWPANFISFFETATNRSLSFNYLNSKHGGEIHHNSNLDSLIAEEFDKKEVKDSDALISLVKDALTQEKKHFKKQNTGVGYHGTSSGFVAFSTMISAIHALENKCTLRPNIFRAEDIDNTDDLDFAAFYSNLKASIKKDTGKMDKGKDKPKPAYNSFSRYSDKVMSLASTLFSGHESKSSPLYFWANNQSIAEPNLEAKLKSFLEQYNIKGDRATKYLNLFKEQKNSENGGLFQFLFTKEQLDSMTTLSESIGYSLKIKQANTHPLSVFEYEELMRENPEKLKQMVLSAKKFRGITEQNAVDIGYPQIRLIASKKATNKIKVKLYPKDPAQFKEFLEKLHDLLKADLSSFSCGQCDQTASGLPTEPLDDLEHLLKHLGKVGFLPI
ncbi:MAG: ankyrin repeat domain-containing protein, partial [Oligoflexia bacterium]|nr:ankyrin repeat domain-containing protein [Oligoflexia bacterium]